MASPGRNFAEWLKLPDGRRIRVSGYEDGSVSFSVEPGEHPPYVIASAFLPGKGNNAIIKLVPFDRSKPAED